MLAGMTDIFHLRGRAEDIARRRAKECRDEWFAMAFLLTVLATPLAFAMLAIFIG
jgi:hypothetical protein